MPFVHHIEDSHEIYGFTGPSPFIFSCEHASNRVPPPLTASPSDKAFLKTHWAWDIGVRQLVMKLCDEMKCISTHARFSRLVCDANRHPNRTDLIKPSLEGKPLQFNQGVDEVEAAARIDAYHQPYHNALGGIIEERLRQPEPFMFISVHSFTPVWNGTPRTMDIGILFDEYEELADLLQVSLQKENFFVAKNEPYSGKFGLMYAAHRHGKHFKIRHLELEFNQAILCTEERIDFVAEKMIRALDCLRK